MSEDTSFVPVLLYHSIASGATVDDPWQVRLDDFRSDMEAVARTGRTALTATAYGQWLRGAVELAGPAVLVTFDDGYADTAELALPVLREYGLAATVFVTTGWVGRPGMLSRSAVAALGGPSTEIGAHSVTHPHLDTLGPAAARGELSIAREVLEDWTGDWVTSVAYPHGSHSRRTAALARDCGYQTAHAVKNCLSHPWDDVFAVGRYTVHARTGRATVAAVLAGRGAPPSPRRERLRTMVYRPVRRVRGALAAG